jgi:hypothetical protein
MHAVLALNQLNLHEKDTVMIHPLMMSLLALTFDDDALSQGCCIVSLGDLFPGPFSSLVFKGANVGTIVTSLPILPTV